MEGVANASARRRWTYAKLLEPSEQCVRALFSRFSPDDYLAITAPNIPECNIFQCGAALTGMFMVIINPTFREGEFEFCLQQSEAVAARVTTPSQVVSIADKADFVGSGANLDGELPTVDPLGPTQIEYTSGTTGAPKGTLIPRPAITTTPKALLLQ